MLSGLKINTYMDERALAIDHTLIRYEVPEKTRATVPSQLGGQALTTAGGGAIVVRHTKQLFLEEGFVRLKTGCVVAGFELKELTLPASVAEVEPQFYRNGGLERLIIRRRLDETDRARLRDNSWLLADGSRLIAPAALAGPALDAVANAAASLAQPLPQLRGDMRFLLYATHNETTSIFDSRACHDPHGRAVKTEEYAAVMEMIRENSLGWKHPAAERSSDLRIRGNQGIPYARPLSLVTMLPGTGPVAQFQVTFSLLFTPQLLPIRCDGQQYYLYSRNRLTADPACPYQREDVCVFDKAGLVTDKKISETVYGKARLLMLL